MKKNLIVFIFFLGLAGCNSHSPNEPNDAAKLEKQRQTKQRIQELCVQYNTVTNWMEEFKSDLLYTVEVQDALIRTDGRPVLVFGTVEDVAKESDKYVVHFGNWLDSVFVEEADNLPWLTDIYFVLDCTPEQVKKIMLHRSVGSLEDYAVIAEISQIRKVEFQLEGYSEDEVVRVRIDPEPLSNVFIAKGKCLDLLFVGE